ncbi:MAG: Hint domain-containing protein [Agriterribacter sp.]
MKILIGDETISVTEDHPFYIVGRGWVRARDINLNYEWKTAESNIKLGVSSIRKIQAVNKVCSFEVEGNHNYFVGRSRILFHNKNFSFIQKLNNKQ